MKVQKERRFKRVHVKLPVAFSLEGETAETRGVAYNLSAAGCRVASTAPVPPGRYLTIRLQLPSEEPPLAVSLTAVRWAMEHDFGLNFLYITTEDYQRLQGFVRELERNFSAVE